MLLAALSSLCIFATLTAFPRGTWTHNIFQAATFLTLAAWCVYALAARRPVVLSPLVLPLVALPVWGLAQVALSWTVYPGGTLLAVLHWGSLAAVFFLTTQVAANEESRRALLTVFSVFAAALAVLCLGQLYTSPGRILWLLPTPDGDPVYGAFPYYNNYAQFVELALPIALYRATQISRRNSFWYAVAAALLYSSVIASTSRAGSIICSLEVAAVLVWAGVRQARSLKRVATRLLLPPALAVVAILITGYDRLLVRFGHDNPFAHRREFNIASLGMIRDRPLTGHGLGAYTTVYPRFAVISTGTFVNAAHNDWAQYAAEGGVVFALLLFGPFLLRVPRAAALGWGLGLAGVLVHAIVDYPFQRPGVAAWIFVLLGAVDRAGPRETAPRA